jgi:hypothetical protein
LFDEFVARGMDLAPFNRAFACFALRNPGMDFAAAISSLGAEMTLAERMALAARLFGRFGAQVVEFLPGEKKGEQSNDYDPRGKEAGDRRRAAPLN